MQPHKVSPPYQLVCDTLMNKATLIIRYITTTDNPQPILDSPLISAETFSSVTISWEFPGGNVSFYLVMVKVSEIQISTNTIITVINHLWCWTICNL